MRKVTRYTKDLVDQIIQEVKDVGRVSLVAEKHNIPANTISTWLWKRNISLRGNKKKQQDDFLIKECKRLKKELEEKEVSLRIMEDLLKKTYQIWTGAS